MNLDQLKDFKPLKANNFRVVVKDKDDNVKINPIQITNIDYSIGSALSQFGLSNLDYKGVLSIIVLENTIKDIMSVIPAPEKLIDKDHKIQLEFLNSDGEIDTTLELTDVGFFDLKFGHSYNNDETILNVTINFSYESVIPV